MPIYEYSCKKCGATFEVLQNMSDDNSNIQCPQCKAGKPERIISLFSSVSTRSSKGTCDTNSFT